MENRKKAMSRGKRKSVCNCVNKGCNFLNYVKNSAARGTSIGDEFLYDTKVFAGPVDSIVVSECTTLGVFENVSCTSSNA